MAWRSARRMTLSLVAAMLLAGCGGGSGGGAPASSPPPQGSPPPQNPPPSTPEPPAEPPPAEPPTEPPAEPVAVRSVGFDDADSDIAAVLLVGETQSPALVLMRDTATGAVRKFVAVLDDGTTAEASADSEGRLGEFVLGEHRFVFTDYTNTHVTATYYAPGGGVVAELIELAGSAAAVTAPGATANAKTHLLSRAQALGPFDELVDETLEWVADASNTYLPLAILRTAGETVAERFEQVRSNVNAVLEAGATQLQDVVHNALSCETSTLAGCAREAAEQVETLIDELAVLDPDAATTAGFEVTETGVQPVLEEWQPLFTPEEITTNFVVIDVPCEESVFAKMNPECPQYVPPPLLEAFDMVLETQIDTPITRALLGSSEATSYELVRMPSNGVVTLLDAATGSFTYTPQSGFSGGDSFSFVVTHGAIRSAEGVVRIAVNDPGTTEPEPEPAPTSTAECKAYWTPILGGTWNVTRAVSSGRERRNWTYTFTLGAADQWQFVEAYEEESIFSDEDFQPHTTERTVSIGYIRVNDLPVACWMGLSFMLDSYTGGTLNAKDAGGTPFTLTR